MKKFVLILFIFIFSGNLFPQDKYNFISSVGLGVSLPMGDITENYNTGFGLSADIGYILSNKVGFNLSLGLNCYGLKSFNTSNIPNYKSGGVLNINTIKLNLLFGNLYPKDKFNYFLFVGIGTMMYNSKDIKYLNTLTEKEESIPGINNNTKFNIDFGLRVIYNVHKRIGVFGEIECNIFDNINETPYYEISIKGRSIIPLRLGIMFNF